MNLDETRQAEDQPTKESRALVPRAMSADAPRPSYHRQAPFLAHLIATKQQFPQTRTRRRAEPEQAITAYRTMADLARWG